jgi:hypothetical protein
LISQYTSGGHNLQPNNTRPQTESKIKPVPVVKHDPEPNSDVDSNSDNGFGGLFD